MTDRFDKVHLLLKQRAYPDALNLIFNSKTGQIRKSYHDDLNHAWYLAGDIFFKLGRLDDATDAFEKAYKDRNNDIQALCALANCNSELNKPKIAEKWLKAALNIEPNNYDLIYNMGNALFDQEKFKEAKMYYEKIGRDNKEIYNLAEKNISACEVRIKNILQEKGSDSNGT